MKQKRQKRTPQNATPTPATRRDVDRRLTTLGKLDREIAAVQLELRETMELAREQAVRRIAPLEARRKQALAGLRRFALQNKNRYFSDPSRSIDLAHGRIGFRRVAKTRTSRETVELLRKRRLDRAIRVREVPDKNEMAKWDEAQLARVGARRVEQDHFYYLVRDEDAQNEKS